MSLDFTHKNLISASDKLIKRFNFDLFNSNVTILQQEAFQVSHRPQTRVVVIVVEFGSYLYNLGNS
jgi:hypothetical protein